MEAMREKREFGVWGRCGVASVGAVIFTLSHQLEARMARPRGDVDPRRDGVNSRSTIHRAAKVCSQGYPGCDIKHIQVPQSLCSGCSPGSLEKNAFRCGSLYISNQ